MISFLRTVFYKAPKVPDPGQRVMLLDRSGWRQGYRAVSGPITSETGEVVILVAEEEEFRSARWDNRLADGMPWPVSQMTVPRRDEQRARRRARREARRGSRQRSTQTQQNNGHDQEAYSQDEHEKNALTQDKPERNGYERGA